ncbi:transglycosylase SLT domain-containing protein [Gluconobacter sphaericus]|uniref:Transglycosylase SLT domain-containing protein n=1 Tax=Gluconobacter sphaericus NBRC 12467 TaxID=1307951 RepID=A0AA37WCI6_9PROT|nr:transglycosylase SLT domain-containing protein [Gluconobacter sphaericus]MBF0885542.1 transglycosylase SLT domain-containing protein [Gluconobacter sphaericus]GBR56506.1 hypothetical protein AA12467_2646 [Gluconobacter sphaericus NBRC 12467]GEB42780.1 hypothetical protein GSP01_15620 [Gluconobacter sphaericus NBRC 12467]GLQ84756.1 hypothetical protein GCM10007872_16640 [Gluconobacter sphaericus NBRC 12467]GLQ85089.1 hypothetical protein GCM10007872_19970 [Gluconobacter sphaericus NBRC 12467
MPTLIDSLVIELNLNAAGTKKGAKEASGALDGLKDRASSLKSNVEQAAKGGSDAFRGLTREALSFFAVLTAGKTLKAFVAENTRANVELGNLSRNLGTSAQTLGTWQTVAESFGGTASDVSGSMQSLVSQFQTIEGRRNLSLTFTQMGVALQDANGKLRSMNDLMPDLARSAQRMGPQLFSALGSQAGFSQGFINMLEQGPEKIEALYGSLKKYAPTAADTKASGQLMMDWVKLTAQSESFGRSIMTASEPALHNLMQTISGLIDANQDWIKTDIVDFIKRMNKALDDGDWRGIVTDAHAFADVVRGINWKGIIDGISQFAKEANSGAEAIGGWKRVAEGFFALWVGSKFLRVLSGITMLARVSGIGLASLTKLIGPLSAAAKLLNPVGDALLITAGANAGLSYLDKHDKSDFSSNLDDWVSQETDGWMGHSKAQQQHPDLTGDQQEKETLLDTEEQEHSLPSGILDALWKTESDRGANAKDSAAGAQGEMQIMPAVAREAGIDPHNFTDAAKYAASALRKYHDQFGSWSKAVAAYNVGPGRVGNLVSEYGDNWASRLPSETQGYLGKVLATMQQTHDRVPGASAPPPADPRVPNPTIHLPEQHAPQPVQVAIKSTPVPARPKSDKTPQPTFAPQITIKPPPTPTQELPPQTVAQGLAQRALAPKTEQREAKQNNAPATHIQNYIDAQTHAINTANDHSASHAVTNNTSSVSANVTVNAHGSDPHATAQAVRQAFNDPRMLARQANLGLM